jgi:hypothetical protein
MDGAGVLYTSKDPHHVAALMDGIVSNTPLRDRIVDGQLAAVQRMIGKDFPGTLLSFVEDVLRAPRQGAARVTFDFWEQFDEAEELEELRQYRPSAYHALPQRPRQPPQPPEGDHARG